jgi:hypothetical protein
MLNRVRISGGLAALAALLVVSSNSWAAINMLANPGFEQPDASAGDQFATTGNSGWNGFNAAYITTGVKETGNQGLKTFGSPGGAFQDFAASPGQLWTGTVDSEKFSGDPMTGTQAAFINIEWHDIGGNLISFLSTKVADATSPADTWLNGVVSGTAPAGTTTARLVLLSGPFNGSGAGGGASFFDNATFSVPEPASAAVLGLVGVAGMLPRRRTRRA